MIRKQTHENLMRTTFLISLLCVALSIIGQYGFNLEPCHLCLYQRYVMVAIVLLTGVFCYLKSYTYKTLLTVTALFFLNAGIAMYQVLIEKKIIDLPESCQKKELVGQSFEAFKDQLFSQPQISCDKIQFEFLGISMAGYNFLLCCGMGIFLICALLKRRSG